MEDLLIVIINPNEHSSDDQIVALLILSHMVDKDRAGETLAFDKSMFKKVSDLLKLQVMGSSKMQVVYGRIYLFDEVLLGILNLSINDGNKGILYELGCVESLIRILQIEYLTKEYQSLTNNLDETKALAIKILWNLSFNEDCSNAIREHIDLFEKMSCSENKKLRENTVGILFSLAKHRPSKPDLTSSGQGLLQSYSNPNITTAGQQHVMISYQWGSQVVVKRIARALEDAGHKIWIDIQDMKGSTMEAMANAVEQASVVLLCITRKYKESPNCRSEAEYTSALKKSFIPLILEPDYQPDGWLGFMLGTKLYYKFEENNFDSKMKDLFREVDTFTRPQKLVKENSGVGVGILPKIEITPPPGIPVEKWDVKGVVEWLETDNYLSEFKQRFMEERINGISLIELASYVSKESLPVVLTFLTESFGNKKMGERLSLIHALKSLR